MFNEYFCWFPLFSIFLLIWLAKQKRFAFPYSILSVLKADSPRTCGHIWSKELTASSGSLVLITIQSFS
jgi:hypothetical protein